MHHYKNNKHHAEHYKNLTDMKDEYIIEMTCDCKAVSLYKRKDSSDMI